ncbi:NTP transferase domain-containing protein [Vagococcus sp. DIV0080]|uniref:NTP transferase domain-containing protein n=1 Tax=Candidatus Vagococcus giribetii TaxID=2230876 RepID=A0ABS3HVU3_9ENTE|nr:NTP transferase domain-containing protein [Vagococcus sp. DIV0080]MBO0477317.1 NTP transferase domain-containing protein [Vagococcus sp. DIV0080]
MNAIILAAGLGSRFGESSKKQHKALLLIENKPNIERTIEFLYESDIEEIIIIVGHLAEEFLYLEAKYKKVKLIKNDFYKEYNNLYSFSLCLNYFGNSYVIDADTVLKENIFEKREKSCYLTILREEENKEWIPITNEVNKLTSIEISGRKDYSLSGISFWTKKDANVIIENYQLYLNKDRFMEKSLYWDNIPIDLLDKLDVYNVKLKNDILYEMDNLEEYHNILKKFK